MPEISVYYAIEAKRRMEADNATAEDDAAYHTVHEHTVNISSLTVCSRTVW